MSTKSHRKSSSSSTLAIVVSSESVPMARAIGSDTDLKKQFEALCKDAKAIQRETEKLVGIVQRNFLKLAQTLHRAKLVYEEWTGTGHGRRRKIEGLLSFDEEIANRTGVSRGLVQKYCQIGKLAPETTSLIEGRKLAGNLTALLRIAQAEGLASVAELTKAVDAFEEGGRKAMDVVLDKAAPKQSAAKNAATTEAKPSDPTAHGEEAANANDDVHDTDEEEEPESLDTGEDAGNEEAPAQSVASETPVRSPKPFPASYEACSNVVPSEPITEPVSSEPITEVVEVPVAGKGGTGVLFGADLVVELVRASGRQAGFVVRIIATKPGRLAATRENAKAAG